MNTGPSNPLPPQPGRRASVPSAALAVGDGATWQVDLLGGPDLQHRDGRAVRLPTRAHVLLLAQLAMAPERAHAREALIELLWPGVAPAVGRNRLRQVLSTLRDVLEGPDRGAAPGVLLADRAQVRVRSGALACDVAQFEAAIRAGDAREVQRLYRGELLPGYYDEWVEQERNRLAELRSAWRDAEAMGAGRSPIGTSHAAAAAPHAFGAEAVSPAIGREPPEPIWGLPLYLSAEFGDPKRLQDLRLTVSSHRLVTLLGAGGIGKTRLAVRLLQVGAEGSATADPAWERGVFVPWAACTEVAQARDALLTALGLRAAVGDDGAAFAQALVGLKHRAMLLVLDNVEALAPAVRPLVTALLEALPQCRLLLTSRRPVGLDGEQRVVLSPLPVPGPDDALETLTAQPAVALLLDRARSAGVALSLLPSNRQTLAALVRRLEGLPLAIELAAGRLRTLSVQRLLALLQAAGDPHLLWLVRTEADDGGGARHQSMLQVVAWSVAQLNADEQALLGALTVLRGDFDAAMAIELADPALSDPAATLDGLLAQSLLRSVAPVDGTPRFALFEAVREYAARQLAPAAAAQARRRLREWAIWWASALPPTPSLGALRAEQPNVLAAIRSAVADGAPGMAVELLLQLRRGLEDAPLPFEGLQLAQQAVQALPEGALRTEGAAVLAPLLYAAGMANPALAMARAILEPALLPSPADWLLPRQRIRALHALARVRWRALRAPQQVEPLLDQAQAFLRDSPDDEALAGVLALRAFVLNQGRRQHAQGEALHRQALALWIAVGNRHAIDSGRYNLAVCASQAGRPAEALQLLEPVLASAHAQRDAHRLSQALNVQGNARAELRDWAGAAESYRHCLQLGWQSFARFDLAYGFWNLPRALAHRGRPEAAARLMGFAARFWEQHFGALSEADRLDLRRVRRLVAVQIGRAACEACWLDGQLMGVPDAFALAMGQATPQAGVAGGDAS